MKTSLDQNYYGRHLYSSGQTLQFLGTLVLKNSSALTEISLPLSFSSKTRFSPLKFCLQLNDTV